MRKQQREITNSQPEIQNNAINDVKQISLSHVIKNQTYGSKIIAPESPSNQLVTQRYNVRSRENLNVPARYIDDQK